HLFLFGDVFADGDNVRYFRVIHTHRYLAYLPRLLLSFEPGFLFHVNDIAAAKHVAKLDFKLAARLPREHLKDVASKHVFAIDSKPAHLSITVPCHDAHVAVDDIKRDREG